MNSGANIAGALRAVANHPLNRHRKLKAVTEYGFIQLATRLIPGDVCVEFPNDTRLLIPPHMKPRVPLWLAAAYCITLIGPLWHTLRGLICDRELRWRWQLPALPRSVLGNLWEAQLPLPGQGQEAHRRITGGTKLEVVNICIPTPC